MNFLDMSMMLRTFVGKTCISYDIFSHFFWKNSSMKSDIQWYRPVTLFGFFLNSYFSFKVMSRSIYITHIQADTDVISVTILQNVTTDVSGNKNTASNILQVRRCKSYEPFHLHNIPPLPKRQMQYLIINLFVYLF